jgi:hypothetical protein
LRASFATISSSHRLNGLVSSNRPKCGEGLHESVLCRFLGVLGRARDEVGNAEGDGLMAPDELRIRADIRTLRPPDELRFR